MACATLKRSLDWDTVLGGGGPSKRRRCGPFSSPSQRDRPSSSQPNSPKPSVFPEVSKTFTSETMAEKIRAELKRMQRRKQLQYSMENSDSSGSEAGDASPSRSEKPIFTFKQVGLICERMLRERETEIREEYDNVLTSKLAEQYEAFVKFTYDQIQKNHNSQPVPSYLS